MSTKGIPGTAMGEENEMQGCGGEVIGRIGWIGPIRQGGLTRRGRRQTQTERQASGMQNELPGERGQGELPGQIGRTKNVGRFGTRPHIVRVRSVRSVRSIGSVRFARVSAIFLFLVASFVLPCHAVELWAAEDGEPSLSLDTALKFSGLGSYAPDAPQLYPERSTAQGLTRLRLTLNTKFNEQTNAQLAYEHRARLTSTDSGGGVGGMGGAGSAILPSFAEAPWRLTQLDWEVIEGDDRFTWRHEFDRAFVSYQPGWGTLTVGRQAIGLGRGVMFSAVDVFSPFSPLEVDREWRRGVDAVRLEYRLSDTSSMEVLGAFGDSWDDSAVLGRIRGYIGDLDGEFIVGKRAEDFMVAGVLSAAFHDAEVHAELALYETPEDQADGGTFGNDHLVAKAVLGSSYTFNVGNGLTLVGEYHYNGFGIKDTDEVMRLLWNEDFQERFLRGDMKNFGRHEMALTLTYPINENLSGTFLVLQNIVDGSGLVSPAVKWDFSQSGSLTVNAFAPWGQSPEGYQIHSEYASTPISLFAQVSLYF